MDGLRGGERGLSTSVFLMRERNQEGSRPEMEIRASGRENAAVYHGPGDLERGGGIGYRSCGVREL